MQQSQPTVTVGRVVHYYPTIAENESAHTNLRPLAAIVIEVSDDAYGACSLHVFAPQGCLDFKVWGKPCTSVPTSGCWTWPPRA